MSKSALETLSKELRGGEYIKPCKAVAQTITIDLDEEMTFQFLKFKKKFKNLNNKEVMQKLLEQAEEPTPQSSLAKLIPRDEQAKSRYIPAPLKHATIGNATKNSSPEITFPSPVISNIFFTSFHPCLPFRPYRNLHHPFFHLEYHKPQLP